MKSALVRFLKDDRGASALDCGVIASLVSVAIIASAESIVHVIEQLYARVTDTLNAANAHIARR
jgi:Flp pilus assembly pilin Flp